MPVLEEGPLQLSVLDKQQIQCTSHTEYVISFNHQKLQARDQDQDVTNMYHRSYYQPR